MLINKIEAVIADLEAPVTEEEAADGWTIEAKQGILHFFENLLKQIKSGEEIKYLGLVRGLDAWGIQGDGSLYKKAMSIARELNLNHGSY